MVELDTMPDGLASRCARVDSGVVERVRKKDVQRNRASWTTLSRLRPLMNRLLQPFVLVVTALLAVSYAYVAARLASGPWGRGALANERR